MKKIAYIVIILVFGFQIYSQAQTAVRFGFQVSPNLTWLSSNDNTINRDGTNLGLRLGVVGEYYFAERYAITSGLGFAIGQGGGLRHDVGGNFLTNSSLSNPNLNDSNIKQPLPDGVLLGYKIQYIEIPIGLKMRTDEIGYFRYFAEIPVFNFSFRAQSRGNIEGEGINEDDLDINKDVNPFNLSWGLGGGVEYSLTSNAVLVAGIYYQSTFIDITKDDGYKVALNPGEEPSDPRGDLDNRINEDSNVNIGSITLRIGVLF